MSTTIHGVERYKGQDVLTTFVEQDMKGVAGYEMVQVPFGSASATTRVLAPVSGKLVGAYVVSATATDATNTVTVGVTNASNNNAVMVTSSLFDDNPSLAANTAVALTVTSTAADAAVNQGDNVEVAITIAGTTIAGGAVALYFEANS